MKKRLLSWLLVLTMVTSLIPSTLVTTAFAAADGVTLGASVTEKTLSASDTSPYEITSSGTYRVTGSSTQPIIVTADAGEVILVLNGVNIQSATSPIQLQKGTLSAAKVTLVVLDGKTAQLACTSTTKAAAESADVAGKTAGINVPDGTTLTIDKISGENGTGTLTISGGYGSAGIGGNHGYGYEGTGYGTTTHSTPITDANQQGPLGFGGDGGYANAPLKGFGGAPGRDGQSAEKSGTVNINACNINITSTAGAGIGGGQGASGENGFEGKQGYKVGDANWVNPAMGSGGGGAGGNGGRGGDCGPVTINGGTLSINVTAPTATSGQKTSDSMHQLTPKDKIQTAGIGGGPGGWGGFGAKGGDTAPANGYSPSSNYYSSGYGGAGGYGETGYVNYGGAAEAITINGGIITVQGVGIAMGSNINAADVRTQAAEQSYAYDYNYNVGKGYQGGMGAHGGRARALTAAPTDNAKISLNGGNISVSSVYDCWGANSVTKNNDRSVFSTAPTAKSNTDGLYPTVIIVKELFDETNVPDAKITVPVKVTGGTNYTYNAMTDANGTAVLWLPEGSYTLQNKSVTHAIGSIPDGTSKTVTVSADAITQTEVWIGSTFSLSLTPDTKVYDQDVSVKADMSKVDSGTISQIRWFRVSAADTQLYKDKADETANIKSFETGYVNASDNDHATIQNPTLDNKTYSISADQNGRYWVEVTLLNGAASHVMIQNVTVTNIYRSYPIRVRSYIYEGVDSLGQPILRQDTGYTNPPDKTGMPTSQTYGFAWDLNGYDAQNPNGANLLSGDVAPYDTLILNAKTANHTWYIAQVNGNQFTDTAGAKDFEPIKLKLDGSFFQNEYCDKENGVKDPGKYTIHYSARDGALDVVTISGVIKDAAPGTDPLYTHTRSYTDAIDNDNITAINWPEYKLVGVQVNGNDAALDKVDGKTTSSITITDIHGKDSGKENKIQTVTFLYEYNMTDVTINACYEGTTTPVEGLSSYKEKMEIGKEYTPTAPAVDGHDLVGSSLQDGKFTPTGKNDVITFYYTKSSGNVTYKAVDGAGNTLWTGSGKVTKGHVPTDVTPDYGITNMTKDDAAATSYTKTADGTDYGNGNKYDGVNDMTVTYTYKHITRNVTVQKIDTTKSGAGAVIETEIAKPYDVGSYQTIAPTNTPSGYKIVGDDSKTVYIEAGTDNLVVKFYYRPSTTADVTIKLFEVNDAGNKVGTKPFQTMTVKVSYGQEQTINAPIITGWAATGDTTKKVNVKNGETAPEIEFLYKPVYDTITVYAKIQGDDTSAPLSTETYQVQQGQSFKAQAPSVVNYKLADGELSVQSLTAEQIKTNKTITFRYVKAEADLITITVQGVVDGVATPLYSYTKDVRQSATDVEVQIFTLNGYKLDNVKMGQTEVTAQNGAYKINPQGTKQTVTATYSSTKTTVTVETKCGGTDLGHGYTVEKELKQETSVFAPSIPGYTATEQNKTFTPDGTAATATQTFQYTKNTGNVVLIAKANGVELFRKDGGTKTKGDTINAADFAAPDVTYYQRTAADPTITVNGQAFTTGDQYDGIGQIEISYGYQRKTQNVTIIKKNVATGAKINEQQLTDLEVGKSHTFANGSVTVPNNYQAVADRNLTSYFVEDKPNQTVTFWYKNTSADQYALVKVNLTCGGKVFQSYPVTAIKGQPTTIQAPTWTGYELKAGTKASATVTPNGTEANDTVEFEYTIKDPKTVTVVLKDNSNTANPDAEMTAPSDYTKTYTLKEGDTLEIWAPAMEGYALRGATLNGSESANMQFVSVVYGSLNDTNTVIFRYLPVAQANFVTHTVKFMLGTQELYSYDKKVDKGTGNVVSYPADAVKSMIPGYTYSETTYEINGHSVNASDVKDNANAVIIYHFKEDTAQITIKFLDKNGNPLMKDGVVVPNQVLSGYRKGQKIEVSAPVLDDFALKTGEKLIQNVTLSSTESNNEISFKYEPLGHSYFFLKEKLTDGATKIIAVINAEENTTYNPNTNDTPLDLSAYGYRFTTDADKVGDDVSPEFAANGVGSVTTSSPLGNKVYTLYYVKGTRAVKFVPVNKDALDAAKLTLEDALKDADFDTKYVIGSVTPVTPADARVGETYQAVAQSFNGWALQDDFSKLYPVENTTAPLKVYFLYAAKSTGDVTVHYHFGDKTNPGKLLNEYTIKAVVGEKVSISAPSYLMDNKYHLRDGQMNPYVLEVTNNTKEVEFYYEANFVVVTAKTVVDGGTATAHETYEVIKDTTSGSGSTTLYPPEKAGYTLVGITADGATLNNGGADKLPDEYTNNKLALTGLATDATVTYYYKTTKASEYQTTLTVEYKYNGYNLATPKTINANTGEANSIDIPAFDGYTASTYVFKDGNGAGTSSGVIGATATVTPAEKTATLTITYTRPDGSIVLPGKGDKIGDSDDIIVKPTDPNTPPTLNPGPNPAKGSVTIPKDPAGNTGTVTRPKDPTKPADGKEDIIVPGGTTIDKDGTIHLPDNGGTIGPEQKIPDALPDTYVAITYDSNNGSGDVKKEIGKKGELKVADSLFTHPTNAKFEGWNDSGLGSGTAYAKDETVDTSITLYAKWSANYKYLAKITYKPNGGTPDKDVLQNVGHDTDPKLKATLQSSPYQVSGWLFGGWNEKADGSGTLYQANKVLSLNDKDAKEFYAQWYKVNADGSITVPGEDGNPKNEDTNATAKGNGKTAPTRNDKGEIEVPKGGSVTLPDGSVIGMPDGGKLLPNGTVIINRPDKDGNGKTDNGTITIPGKTDPTKPDVTDKNGNEEQNKTVYTLTYTINNGENDPDVVVKAVQDDEVTAIDNPFAWTGHTFINWLKQSDSTEVAAGAKFTVNADETFHAQWIKQNTDGSIELPGKDASMTTPKDNVLVTPDKPNGTVTKQPDGSAKVEGNSGTVNRPKDPDHLDQGKENIKVPEGTIVKPDGTIILPNNGGTINPGDKIDGNNNLTGYFVVTFLKGEAENGDPNKMLVKAGNITLPAANTFTAPSGKIFTGWKTGDEIKQAGTEYTVTANVTFTAQFKKIQTGKAVVTFDFDGGTAGGKTYETRTGDPGTKLGTPPNPTRGGYTFAGWNEQINENTLFGEENSTTIYTAQWTAKTYTIHYNGSGATGNVADQTYVFNSADAKLAQNSFTLADKVFLGWSVNKDATSAMFREGEEIGDALRAILTNLDKNSESELTLYAIWKDNQVTPSEAIAIFDFAGGKDANGNTSVRKTGAADAAITITAPTREGYTFAGWDKGEPKFGATGTVTVFTAQWTADKHEVTFEVGDGTKGEMNGDASVQVDHNSSVEANKVPTITAKTGYVFIGWSDGTSVFAKEAIQNYKVTADVTFTAQYEEDSKSVVIFDYNGGKDADGKSSISMSGDANAAINSVDAPTRDGYTFAGWKNGEQDVNELKFGAAGSVTTYTAAWTADPDKTFKVNFVVDATKGDVTDTTEFDVVSGSFLTEVPTVNAKEGYTFIGWSDGKNTYFTSGVKLYTITGATTFTALFEKADNNNPNPPAKDTLTVSGNTTAKRGDKVNFKALLNGKETDNVTWTVAGGKTGTTISEAGVLTVGSSETNGTTLTITATSKSDSTLTASTILVVLVDSGNTGGGSSGGSSGGGSSSGGSSSGGGSGSGSSTTKPSQPDTKPTPGTKPNDPTQTGIANWLRTDKHTTSMTGYGNGKFGPEDSVTRAQVAQIFHRLLKDQNVAITASFSDVADDAWYAKAVNTLASLGIIKGTSEGKFDPNRAITRAEFCAIATRFAKVASTVKNPFADINEQDWYYTAVTTAASYDWVNGMSDGNFHPHDVISRAQAATIINRMLGAAADRSYVDSHVTNPYTDVSTTYWAYYQIIEASIAHDHDYDKEGVEIWTGLK